MAREHGTRRCARGDHLAGLARAAGRARPGYSAPGGRERGAVGAGHAGGRGLAAGVLEATVARLAVAPAGLIAWLGPAIGPAHFEVGGEVRAAFLAHDPAAAAAFSANSRGRWQCDLSALARRRLSAAGVGAGFRGRSCTYADPARFL